jgi:hypothetical protein
MADILPTTIPTVSEPSVATYDFWDIGTGRGIKTLYAGDLSGSHVLTTLPFYGWDGHSNVTNAAIDVDFDMTLLKPITIQGSAVVNFTGATKTISAGPLQANSTFTVYLRHYDGTTETDLGSGSWLLSGSLDDGASQKKLMSFDLDVAKTRFAIGETLRLTITATNPGTTREVQLYNDPKNRTFTTGTGGGDTVSSICALYLPIVVDI